MARINDRKLKFLQKYLFPKKVSLTPDKSHDKCDLNLWQMAEKTVLFTYSPGLAEIPEMDIINPGQMEPNICKLLQICVPQTKTFAQILAFS